MFLFVSYCVYFGLILCLIMIFIVHESVIKMYFACFILLCCILCHFLHHYIDLLLVYNFILVPITLVFVIVCVYYIDLISLCVTFSVMNISFGCLLYLIVIFMIYKSILVLDFTYFVLLISLCHFQGWFQ